MKNILRFACFVFCFFCLLSLTVAQSASKMTNEQMGEILKEQSSKLEGDLGGWQALFEGRLLLIVTDENANRMRIFTPIVEEQEIETSALKKMLEANFHSALDAKYCLFDGFVISVYTHPLGELTEEQFIDALRQVATLAANYGTSYSSTDFIFSPGLQEPKEEGQPSRPINKKPRKS